MSALMKEKDPTAAEADVSLSVSSAGGTGSDKVWIVTEEDYEYYAIRGLYRSEEDANIRATQCEEEYRDLRTKSKLSNHFYTRSWNVEKYEIDKHTGSGYL